MLHGDKTTKTIFQIVIYASSYQEMFRNDIKFIKFNDQNQ